MKVKLSEVSSGFTKNIAQKDLDNNNGCYPIYGASGYIKNINFYISDKPYIGIVKDGSGVGRVNIYPAYSSLLGTMQYVVPNDNMDIAYLMYALRYMKLGSLYSGAAIPHIYYKNYQRNELNYREKNEQKSISTQLTQIENAILVCNAKIIALDELVKSRFIEMFGHPDANEKGWEKSKLENFINVVGGYAFKSQKYLSKGIPVLRIGNINAGYFRDTNLVFYQEDSALEKYKIYPNDLVISLTGTAGKDDYGNICLMDSTYGVYYLNQRNAKIEIKHNFNRFFLMYLFAHPEIKQRLTGKNHGIRQGNILNKDILELDVYVPPIELQNEFADFVKLIDKSKFIVQKQIDDLQELLDSKMDEYFG